MYETVNYFIIISCLVMHSRLFDHRFDKFSVTYTTSLYFLVQTSTTAGYGDLMPIYDTNLQIFLIFLLIVSISFFAYFLARIKRIIDLMSTSYRSMILTAEEDMHSWLSLRDKDADKREPEGISQIHSAVTKKISNTYRSYIAHDIAGTVQEHDLFHKLSYKHQHIIIERAFITFLKIFSYLTKLIGVDSMHRIFSMMTKRV